MKSFNIISGIIIAFVFISCADAQTKSVKTNLSAAEFSEKIKQLPNSPVIDVRTPEEFSKGHLVNALNININGSDFDSQISKIDKTKPVFVYCLSGARSASAAGYMRSKGFKEVYELSGGIMKWRAANLPETTANTVATKGMSKSQFNDLIKLDRLILVDFYADWCAPCKKMKPYLEEISNEMKDKVTVIRINADDNQNLTKELGIDALPVLQLYKSNVLIWSNVGYISKEEVVKHLN